MAEPKVSVRIQGHAFRGSQTNVYGDRRYLCECGAEGSPVRSVDDARAEHRIHKRWVTLDIARHPHGGLLGYSHTHCWASVPHDHMLRALCHEPECQGSERHNIHPRPTTGVTMGEPTQSHLSRQRRCEECEDILVGVVFRHGTEWYCPRCELGEGGQASDDVPDLPEGGDHDVSG